MTLHDLLERAAEIPPADRWELFQCVRRNPRSEDLPPTTTGGIPRPPRYCPVCYTVLGPKSFRMWNPPFKPFD
jgi:hypothetical protein